VEPAPMFFVQFLPAAPGGLFPDRPAAAELPCASIRIIRTLEIAPGRDVQDRPRRVARHGKKRTPGRCNNPRQGTEMDSLRTAPEKPMRENGHLVCPAREVLCLRRPGALSIRFC